MQRKLATWAATDPSLRIQRLLRLITQPEWLAEAARITLSSKGAHTPGVDGVNKTMLQARLAVELQILRDELLSGHYQPLPARRVYIPKSNGKLRPLGIPALRDRIVQRAMLMAMEPIWESDFHTLSYGFRPERSVHHAIRTVKLQLTDCGETRGRWVIEGDLSSYFDTVHHRLLMKAVRRRISDARFMTLLWKTIKAGHIDVGLFRQGMHIDMLAHEKWAGCPNSYDCSTVNTYAGDCEQDQSMRPKCLVALHSRLLHIERRLEAQPTRERGRPRKRPAPAAPTSAPPGM